MKSFDANESRVFQFESARGSKFGLLLIDLDRLREVGSGGVLETGSTAAHGTRLQFDLSVSGNRCHLPMRNALPNDPNDARPFFSVP